ncbi:polysaccharide biosynthesis protein [Halomonas maura]|uniref:polysaccharide biosynthesis protein n=1 Tax=Halomonas maura TaxID=117606 RepID=UPI0025B3999E|nr:nucleoside-diphosphate sugar epimerase/dehydratase [Halomonas maura]MDN3554976.1 nucleoside-diphosphate sugar epimerase/dehydratase [Halomonas maura]
MVAQLEARGTMRAPAGDTTMMGLETLVRMPRRWKRALLRLMDALLMAFSLLVASLLVRNDGSLGDGGGWLLLGVAIAASPLIFQLLGVYRVVLRFMHLRFMVSLVSGVGLVSACLLVIDQLAGWPVAWQAVPVFAMLAILAVSGLRLLLLELYLLSRHHPRKPVIIYGAGVAGCELARALHHGGLYRPCAFVDDWRGLQGSLVEGLPVYSPEQLENRIEQLGIELVLLAIPSAPRCRRRQILEQLERLSIPVQTIPGSEDLVSGRSRIADTCDVQVEDLLGRDPVPPFPELMTANIRDKVVMVTGAGGSIGSELCRQILAQEPRVLVLVDNAEHALYAIEQELQLWAGRHGSRVRLRGLLASIQQGERMREILSSFGVQTLYHAAAYKHVPIVECNLVEGLRNNVFGTLALATAAVEARVETFVMVSTDKAVRPTNVMGATKRLTELICQAFAGRRDLGHGKTRFCMVRFGNVLGSSGSVVPLFRTQIERGGPIEVTHPEITRYFMTIPEAAQLVIQAGAMGSDGQVFVLDMGEPVRIAELAASMVRLSGLEVKDDDHPEGDVEIHFTGLRPGEKLYEELLIGSDVQDTRHPRIMTSRECSWAWPELEAYLVELHDAMSTSQHRRIQELLIKAPLGYSPEGEMVDLVWEAQHASSPRAPVTQEASTSSDLRLVRERLRSSGSA